MSELGQQQKSGATFNHVCLPPDSVAKLCFVRFLDVRYFYKQTFSVPHSLSLGLAVICRRIWPAF
jgi:hypothetical protein